MSNNEKKWKVLPALIKPELKIMEFDQFFDLQYFRLQTSRPHA